ncbi:hypothetical protein LZ906_017595 (plasmid) [Paraclostridium ghonii]|uniref:hypothetical protein n=1 Tax=Paraclostridium ghonii TaxID=29358 RepID=UPI00202CDA11|nr:hypothetical protein [Paeniclostridium ghonii]MCM0168040.1 hypothetical protein [Paeniclostridium ghonii]
MPTQTTNLKLTKLSYTDAADIAVISNNMDIIDTEVNKKADKGHKHSMSDIQGLSLEAKKVTIEDSLGVFDSTNVEGALSELFQSVSNGKSSVAKAITDKGIPASANDDFTTLANKISQIIAELLNIPFPNFSVNVGSIDATFDTLDSTFKEFRIQGQAWQTSNIFRGLMGNTSYSFEAKYGGNRVSKLSLITPKANQSQPSKPVASNIDGESVTITAPTGCRIRFLGSNFDSPRTFTGLDPNTVYEFTTYKPATEQLNDSPNSDVLRVQTLNSHHLFKDGVGELDSLMKWDFPDAPDGTMEIRNGVIRLKSANAERASFPLIDLIDTRKYSRIVFVVKKVMNCPIGGFSEFGEITVNNHVNFIEDCDNKIVEFDVSSFAKSKIELAICNKFHDANKPKPIMEISEIYLSN